MLSKSETYTSGTWDKEITCAKPVSLKRHGKNVSSLLFNGNTKNSTACCSDTSLVKKVKKSLKSSGLVRAVGIATSLANSGNQWLVLV